MARKKERARRMMGGGIKKSACDKDLDADLGEVTNNLDGVLEVRVREVGEEGGEIVGGRVGKGGAVDEDGARQRQEFYDSKSQ